VNLLLERIGVLSNMPSQWPDWLGSGLAAVIILLSLNLFPIMYLNITASIANLDPALIQAARNLGASRRRTFFSVVLPLIRPGLFAGGSIVFVWAFTDIGTPLLVGYGNLAPVTIFKELVSADTSPRTYSLVFVVLMIAIAIYTTSKLSFGRALIIDSPKGSTAGEPQKLGKALTFCVWCAFGGVMMIALLPHLGVVMLALSERWVTTIIPEGFTTRHVAFILNQPETRDSIINSFKYAGVATVVDVFVGFIAAWMIVRRRSFASSVLDILVMLPLAVPGLILAAGFIAMTVSGSWFESIGPRRDPFLLLVIAYSIRRLPFVVRGMCAGLEQIPQSLEQAARNLGAKPFEAITRITIPLVSANLVASTVLVFSFAMIEVSDSLVLAQLPVHFPITKEIYNLAVIGGADAQNMAAALGLVGMLVLGSALGTAAVLMGKRLGSIFRM
jgi:iron(III) transport system permease protein